MLAFPALPTTASAWLIALLDAAAKSALVLAAAALAAFAMRRASAALRHLVWTLAIVSVLCLPFLSLLLPAWPVLRVPAVLGARASQPSELLPEENLEASLPPLSGTTAPSTHTPQPPSEARPPAEPAASDPQPSRPSPPTPARPAAARAPRAIPSVLLLIWSLGAAVALLPLLVGMYAVRRLTRRARPFTDPAWHQLLRAAAAQFALRRPLALLRSSPDTVPMMAGLLRPALLLPAGADAWPASRRRLVLLHELAHVKRADYLSQILAHLAAAIYWFNPLAWLALYCRRRERERACDDLVLNTGFRASEYAQHLPEISRGARGAAFCSIAAVPMARPTSLEGRVRAILDARRNRRGVTRPSALLAVLAVAAIAIPLARLHALPAPTRLGEGPDGRALYQWNPSESWPGGSQHDAHLDQPVHFWRAGLALSDVFDSVAEQTGATLRFFPEGDENERVRVSLYLNRENPPTLRDLMAQIAWVTDCAFAYTQADTGEPGPSYYLLSTSIGQAVPLAPAVLEQRAEQRSRLAEQPAPYRTEMDREAAIKASLKKLRQALALPREELIARYKGVDDYLLYTLTADPRWPAAAEYICGTIDEDVEPAPGREDPLSSTRKWADLTEEERALVSHGLHLRKSDLDLIAAAPEAEVRIDCQWDALDITVSARMGGGSWLGVGAFWTPYFTPTPERALLEMDRWQPRTVAHFLRSIGEEVPDEDEEVVAGRWKAAVSKKRRQQELAALAKSALSPATADLLASLTLPVEAGRPYALWELQHAIATASGLNVISDCFWQPPRPLHDTESALIALASAARAWSKQATELRDAAWMVGSEWTDAGSFLRFRSIDRDIWRASVLPADVLAEVDEYLSPYLPEVAEPEWPPTGFSLQLTQDPLVLIRIGSSLDDLQLSYGGLLLYEDPAEPTAACRHALRSSFLGCPTNELGCRPSAALNATRALEAFRLITSLSEGQWARARTPGGLPSDQLTPEQLDRASRAVAWWDTYQDPSSVLRLRAAERVSTRPRDAGRPLEFYVALAEPKEAREFAESIPEDHKHDIHLFHWECEYRLDVPVPRPLSLPWPAADSPL